MKNPEQGSSTTMVGQNAYIFPVPDTFSDLTPAQAKKAAGFLAKFRTSSAPNSEGVEVAAPPLTRRQRRREARERQAALIAERRKVKRRQLAEARGPADYTRPEAWTAPLTVARVAPAPVMAPVPQPGQEQPQEAEAWMVTMEELDASGPAWRQRPPPKPRVRMQALPLPELAELIDLESFRPRRGRGAGTAGAGALAELLHELARRYLSSRPYLYRDDGSPPRQVVLHLCAEMLAFVLEVSDNTIREWAAQLEREGFVFSHVHLTTMTRPSGERITAADGTLYAVRLAPRHKARLRYGDYQRVYRDLDADRKAGRTAYNAIRWAELRAEMRAEAEAVQNAEKNSSVSFIPQKGSTAREEIRQQLHRWAVIPGGIALQNPLDTDSELFGADELNTVQDVVYLLPTLTAAHRTKRAALVGIMAATIATALADQHSRKYWCRIIWEAWTAELEGREGLQHLASQLQRLVVDISEWREMRNPAAVFAARMRAA